MLVCHYPLLDRNGDDYSVRHSWHGIDNNSQVCDTVREAIAPLLAPQQPQNTDEPLHTEQPTRPLPTPSSQPPPSASPLYSSSCRSAEHKSAAMGAGVGTAALLLHGHVHRGYSVPFPLVASQPPQSLSASASASVSSGTSFPIYNPGSAGRSFSAGKRAAAYNLYTISRDEPGNGSGSSGRATDAMNSSEAVDSGCREHRMNGWRLAVERFVHNGHTFEKEALGPYTTPY